MNITRTISHGENPEYITAYAVAQNGSTMYWSQADFEANVAPEDRGNFFFPPHGGEVRHAYSDVQPTATETITTRTVQRVDDEEGRNEDGGPDESFWAEMLAQYGTSAHEEAF